MHKIEIKALKLYGYHGCMNEELLVGADFFIDLSIQFNASLAMQTDNLNETIDYVKVIEIVSKEFEKPSKLIENVAYRIAKALKTEIKKISTVEVSIQKPSAPIGKHFQNISFTAVL